MCYYFAAMKYLLLLLLALPAFGQVNYTLDEAEYGNVNELKGKTKVFLAVDDMKAREIIAKEVEQHFTIVFTRAEAEFGIRFIMGNVDAGSNVLLGTAHNVVVVGEFYAYTWLPVPQGSTKGRVRVLWQTRKSQDFSGGLTFNKHPAKNAVNDFLKAWKRVK